jgi:hypothetical protein
MVIDILIFISEFLCDETNRTNIVELKKWKNLGIAKKNYRVNLRTSWMSFHNDYLCANRKEENALNGIHNHAMTDLTDNNHKTYSHTLSNKAEMIMCTWHIVKISPSEINQSENYLMNIKNASLNEMPDIINHITLIVFSVSRKEVHVGSKRRI